jgi:nucleotide-binding universal stress UspA family protein
MKNILVPLLGIDSDKSALNMAYLAAQPFSAHLDCVHVSRGPLEIAMATADVGAGGIITQELWEALEDENRKEAANAKAAFDAFRKKFDIRICEQPAAQAGVTASLHNVLGQQFEQIALAGRTRELVVLARGKSVLAPRSGQIGDVLMECGRPVLLAPEREWSSPVKTVAIAWKDTPESARAVQAALPLILKAERVVLLSVGENGNDRELLRSMSPIADELRWHGINPQMVAIARDNESVAHALVQAAERAHADLLVMGAYGHTRLQEFVLGGATRDILDGCALPVFLFR